MKRGWLQMMVELRTLELQTLEAQALLGQRTGPRSPAALASLACRPRPPATATHPSPTATPRPELRDDATGRNCCRLELG